MAFSKKGFDGMLWGQVLSRIKQAFHVMLVKRGVYVCVCVNEYDERVKGMGESQLSERASCHGTILPLHTHTHPLIV